MMSENRLFALAGNLQARRRSISPETRTVRLGANGQVIGKLIKPALIPHSDHPAKAISGVEFRWFEPGDGTLILRWQVFGVEALAIPAFAGKGRGEDLWRTTCFELFLRDAAGKGYIEFNFSPSERWATYWFDGYREGRVDLDLPVAPEVSSASGAFTFVLTATIDINLLDGAAFAGVSAVIEEKDGTKSYWALAHAPGEPDFHNPACFALPIMAEQHA